MAGVERGLTTSDIKEMEIGHVVDFIMEYNKRHESEEDRGKKEQSHRRMATQADWDAFWS